MKKVAINLWKTGTRGFSAPTGIGEVIARVTSLIPDKSRAKDILASP
jgi:hypothetical protein